MRIDAKEKRAAKAKAMAIAHERAKEYAKRGQEAREAKERRDRRIGN